MAMHEGEFLQPSDAPLACKTVSGAINHMAASFRSHRYPNPSHNKHGALDWNLAQQYCSYKLSDPKEIQQKAIPLSVVSLIVQANTTKMQQATTQLIVGAFFFACRLCKNLQVPTPEEKQTKILMLENISFYKDKIELPHSETSELATANHVSITFISQKNGRKNNTITQWRANVKVLCPVIQWAALVHCLPWCNTGDTSVHHLGTQSTFACNQQNRQRQGQTTCPPPRSWHSLNKRRRHDGYVSRGGPSVCNHVNRMLVKHRLYELHPETNRRIYLQRVNFHAHYATFNMPQTHHNAREGRNMAAWPA
jgi:hypothetical protein